MGPELFGGTYHHNSILLAPLPAQFKFNITLRTTLCHPLLLHFKLFNTPYPRITNNFQVPPPQVTFENGIALRYSFHSNISPYPICLILSCYDEKTLLISPKTIPSWAQPFYAMFYSWVLRTQKMSPHKNNACILSRLTQYLLVLVILPYPSMYNI